MSANKALPEIQENILLAPYTSWLIGGPAEYFSLPRSVDECIVLLKWAKANSQSVTILGGGSNVLVSDLGVKGLVICLRQLAGLEVKENDGRVSITAFAGVAKSELLKIFLRYKLQPSLFLAGLPGDVGGGVVMNAGVGEQIAPREFVEIVDWVEVLNTETFKVARLQKSDLRWSYRHCHGWEPGIVTCVGMSWPNNPQEDILPKVREANKVRLQKQPLHMPSCGSVFINPPGHKAGQLIDNCGLRGFQVGGAQVSEKHANFIVNVANATAMDVHAIILYVQKTVMQKTGVQLKTEVRYLGQWLHD